MNFYFNFFNDKDNKYLIMNNINNSANINLNKFNMKVYLSDLPFDSSKITDVKLYIERIANGSSIFYKYFSGSINSDTIDFSNVVLEDDIGKVVYKVRLQFFSGGILFHDSIDNILTINLKTSCENFSVDIFDAIKINDTYELQSFNDETFEMKFKISLSNEINSNGLLYNFLISPDENVEFKSEYKPFDSSLEFMSYVLVSGLFKNNITYLHFSIKDQFNNVLNEKFKITTKSGTLSLFEILNNELVIDYNEEFAVFYNAKNVNSITPFISYEQNGETINKKSEKTISSYDKKINVITIKLTDYFEIDSKFNNDLKLKFVLNNDDKLSSNEMLISIDSEKPKITLNNIKDKYHLIKNDVKHYTINGKLEDNNFFYIGSNQKKIDISAGKKTLYIFSEENIKYVTFNGEKVPVLKYSNFYVAESKGYEFEVYDYENQIISNYQYINDYCDDNEKVVYFLFNQKDFTKYELNIINNNKGLMVKGSEITPLIKSQKFDVFNDVFYLKVIFDKELVAESNFVKFDLGIEEVSYSFLYKVNQNTCSADLNNLKKIDLSFSETKIIAIKSNEDVTIHKCNINKITGTKKTFVLNELVFSSISNKSDEYLIVDSNLVFFEEEYNLITPSFVYASPKLILNKLETSYNNYNIKLLDDNIYSFSLDVPIDNGVNKFKLTFTDSNDIETSSDFVIEKNKNNIYIDIDETYNNYFDKSINKDGIYTLTTNSSNVIVKFLINSESLGDLKEDKYLIIKSDKSSKKQKILSEDNNRVAYVSFNNFGDSEFYNIFYNDETNEIGSFILNYKETIILNVENNFVSGSNTYFLKYKVDEFAKVNFSNMNKKAFKCELLPNNIISITRLDNKGFLEEIDLEITAYDKNHLYEETIRNVHGIFYNDSIIASYKIDDSIFKDGLIASSSFDLELYTNHNENIEYIKYYDECELDITKRNKYALYDKNKSCYIIRNIVSPLSPKSLEISIKIKDTELTINKTLFDNKIKLLNDKNNFSFTYFIDDDNLNLKLTNLTEDEYFFDKLEYYIESNHIYTENKVSFDKRNTNTIYKIPLDKLTDSYTFTIKGFNIFGKVNFVKSILINCNTNKLLDAELENFKEFCLFEVNKLKQIKLISNLDNKNIYLEIEDVFGKKQKVNHKDSYFDIDLEKGFYNFRLIYRKYNYKKIINTYNVEIIDNINKLIDYSTDYLYFDSVNEIIFRKQFNTSFEYLSPSLFHYCNDKLVEILSPIFDNDSIRFHINKKIGNNKFVYKDDFSKIELKDLEFKEKDSHDKYKIFAIHTDNQTMFYNDEDYIYLRNVENLYFKTIGITEVRTTTRRIRSTVKQRVSDYITTTIFKEFIPCSLDFYIDDVLVKSINIEIDSIEPIIYPIFSKDLKRNKIEKNKFKMFSVSDGVHKDTYPFSIKHNIKHYLLNYADGLAKIYNDKHFLNLSFNEKEEVLSNIGISTNNTEELKNKILFYFKGGNVEKGNN